MVNNVYHILTSRVSKTRFWDYKSSLWDSVCMIWCGLIATWHSHRNQVSKTRFPRVYDVAIKPHHSQVEPPGNRVSDTRFPIGVFSNLCLFLLSHYHSHSHSHPTPTPTPTHSQSQARALISNETSHTLRTHLWRNRPTLTLGGSLIFSSLSFLKPTTV